MPFTVVVCSMLKINFERLVLTNKSRKQKVAKFLTTFACCIFFGNSFYNPQHGGKANSAGWGGKWRDTPSTLA